IRLEYRKEGNRWTKPAIRVKLSNNSDRYLYCALLSLAEDFEITAAFFPTGSVRLGPGEEAFAFAGKPIPSSVPDALWKQGIIEFRDVLKLVVAPTRSTPSCWNSLPSPFRPLADGRSRAQRCEGRGDRTAPWIGYCRRSTRARWNSPLTQIWAIGG